MCLGVIIACFMQVINECSRVPIVSSVICVKKDIGCAVVIMPFDHDMIFDSEIMIFHHDIL